MEDYSAASVSVPFGTEPSSQQPIKGAGWRKKIIIVIFIVFPIILLGILIGWYFLNSGASDLQTTTRQIAEGEVSSGTQTHPEIFFAYLHYNPTTGLAVKQESGVVSGSPSESVTEMPLLDPTNFTYKVEVFSLDDNSILQTRWYSVPLGLIENEDGTLNVFAGVFYRPGAMLQIALPDEEIIWTGKIE